MTFGGGNPSLTYNLLLDTFTSLILTLGTVF